MNVRCLDPETVSRMTVEPFNGQQREKRYPTGRAESYSNRVWMPKLAIKSLGRLAQSNDRHQCPVTAAFPSFTVADPDFHL